MIKIIFSQLYVYIEREPLKLKLVAVSVSFFHFAPFRSYVTRNATDLFVWVPVTIFYDRCRHNLQNKMATQEATVHRLQIVFVTISPSAQRAKVVHRDVKEV